MRSTDELYAGDTAALASSVSASLKKTSDIKKVQKMTDMDMLMTTMKIMSGCSMLASVEELSLNRSLRRASVSPDTQIIRIIMRERHVWWGTDSFSRRHQHHTSSLYYHTLSSTGLQTTLIHPLSYLKTTGDIILSIILCQISLLIPNLKPHRDRWHVMMSSVKGILHPEMIIYSNLCDVRKTNAQILEEWLAPLSFIVLTKTWNVLL